MPESPPARRSGEICAGGVPFLVYTESGAYRAREEIVNAASDSRGRPPEASSRRLEHGAHGTLTVSRATADGDEEWTYGSQ